MDSERRAVEIDGSQAGRAKRIVVGELTISSGYVRSTGESAQLTPAAESGENDK